MKKPRKIDYPLEHKVIMFGIKTMIISNIVLTVARIQAEEIYQNVRNDYKKLRKSIAK